MLRLGDGPGQFPNRLMFSLTRAEPYGCEILQSAISELRAETPNIDAQSDRRNR